MTFATGCSPGGRSRPSPLASAVVVLGHAATFLIAARAAGATAPPSRMLPLAFLAMLAMVLPSAAGWGPREGATAWVFASAGLGADVGVATAVAYGIMAVVASLPGALVLVGAWLARSPASGAASIAAPGPGRGRRPAGRSPRCVTARTPCSRAACRSTATSGARRRGSFCPTTTTSTESTRSAPPATRSWSARRPCGSTTRGSWCAHRPAATSGRRGGSRRRR